MFGIRDDDDDNAYFLKISGEVNDNLREKIALLTKERNEARALIRISYNAGYYQAECGLPDHGDIHQAATEALNDLVKNIVEQTLNEASAYIQNTYGIGALAHPTDRSLILSRISYYKETKE